MGGYFIDKEKVDDYINDELVGDMSMTCSFSRLCQILTDKDLLSAKEIHYIATGFNRDEIEFDQNKSCPVCKGNKRILQRVCSDCLKR